jgi:hypothetical protein
MTDTRAAADRSMSSALKRSILLILPLLVLAIAPGPSRAGNIVYTWHETDGQSVSGSLSVSDTALTTLVIDSTDVVSTSFSTPHFSSNSLSPFSPITIGSSGIPTAGGEFDESTNTLLVPFSSGTFTPPSSPPSGESTWQVAIDLAHIYHGVGYWTVSGASAVPEPSSGLLAAIGALSGIAYARFGKRRAQRRRPTGGPSEPTE